MKKNILLGFSIVLLLFSIGFFVYKYVNYYNEINYWGNDMLDTNKWLLQNNANLLAVGKSSTVFGELKEHTTSSDRIFIVINVNNKELNLNMPFSEIKDDVGIFDTNYSYSTINKQEIDSHIVPNRVYDISVESSYFEGKYSYNIYLFQK